MSQIIDRRLNGKNKSSVNRQRFIHRYKKQIKKAVNEAIAKRSIKDMDKGEKVTIPAKDTSEPIFHHGQGGKRDMIHPGNKEFTTGDQIQRPNQGGGQGRGNQASDKGEGEDDFVFQLSREEFLELFFEDLELPDLVKKQFTQIPSYKYVRAGFVNDGVPTNIDLVRSFRNAVSRRIAMGAPSRLKLREFEKEFTELEDKGEHDSPRGLELQEQIRKLKHRINALPFIDNFDLRYHNRVKRPEPTTQAVMFCLMDVSGSMDEAKKDIAKRFFILLYLFLKRNYEKIEVVFIRHHTSAKEVDEEEFFYSRETGGTVVSSALEMMADIMNDRYPPDAWNIYAAQASDGDNWNADSPRCQQILLDQIMPKMQYFSYVEIMPRHHQSLWESYQGVAEQFENFAMQSIDDVANIYPVFRELFKRQSAWARKNVNPSPRVVSGILN